MGELINFVMQPQRRKIVLLDDRKGKLLKFQKEIWSTHLFNRIITGT